MNQIFIGQMLYGYCNGYFGRDSYNDKRIEAYGVDWLVVRDKYGHPDFATFDNNHEMLEKIAEWSIKPQDDYYE